MALQRRDCPTGYQMVNGVCESALSDDCCDQAMEAAHQCHSHPGTCGWMPSGCECQQHSQLVDDNWQYTYCACHHTSTIMANIIACCYGDGYAPHGMGDWGGGRGFGGRRAGGRIKRRGRK